MVDINFTDTPSPQSSNQFKPNFVHSVSGIDIRECQEPSETISRPKGELCECIDTRQIHIDTQAGKKPAFLLTLETKLGKILYKFLNVRLTPKGNCTVPHNSDFAKLYRLTLGENPMKGFSKPKQLLNHFLECKFFAEYEPAVWSDGSSYLKATSLQPLNPIQNNDWTSTGQLRKKRHKRANSKSKKDGNEVEIGWKPNGEKMEKEWKNNGDEKTLKPAKTLGLEPVFNPIQHIPAREESYNHYTTTYPGPERICISDTETLFIHRQRENESLSEYYDRIIDETFFI